MPNFRCIFACEYPTHDGKATDCVEVVYEFDGPDKETLTAWLYEQEMIPRSIDELPMKERRSETHYRV